MLYLNSTKCILIPKLDRKTSLIFARLEGPRSLRAVFR